MGDGIANWHRWIVIAILGIGAYTIQKRLQPPLAVDWVSHPDAHRESVVTTSRWAGEAKADASAIKSALLTGEAAEVGWVVVTRPDGRKLQAEREKKGWRIEGAGQDAYSDCAIYRKNGYLDPVHPPKWNLLANEPGDFFTLLETEEILVAFAERRPLPPSVVSRTIVRKSYR